jgi:hypothetical protein
MGQRRHPACLRVLFNAEHNGQLTRRPVVEIAALRERAISEPFSWRRKLNTGGCPDSCLVGRHSFTSRASASSHRTPGDAVRARSPSGRNPIGRSRSKALSLATRMGIRTAAFVRPDSVASFTGRVPSSTLSERHASRSAAHQHRPCSRLRTAGRLDRTKARVANNRRLLAGRRRPRPLHTGIHGGH